MLINLFKNIHPFSGPGSSFGGGSHLDVQVAEKLDADRKKLLLKGCAPKPMVQNVVVKTEEKNSSSDDDEKTKKERKKKKKRRREKTRVQGAIVILTRRKMFRQS